MRSVVLDFDRRTLAERDIPEPRISMPGDVLFRVHEVGVCGTDRELAAFRMRPRERDRHQLVLGHEALGQVVETGADVHGFEPGDWVVPTIRRGCAPPCTSCAHRRPDLCLTYAYSERGIFNLDGYFTEYAVDAAENLIRIPPALVPYAVMLEPLSVVEKAVQRAICLRQSEGRSALVLGLGAIGMLTAMVLQSRGYQVQIYSQEPQDHQRAVLMRSAGIGYGRSLEGRHDLIVEASGCADLALAALGNLSSCGVFIALGAQRTTGEISFIDLIVGNQTVAGVVNASRASFEMGVRDLPAFPEFVLRGMIRRFGFSDFAHTLVEPSHLEPKFVHVIAE
jgi:glucose 1-dehydrogenase